jgi:hypothetical protein
MGTRLTSKHNSPFAKWIPTPAGEGEHIGRHPLWHQLKVDQDTDPRTGASSVPPLHVPGKRVLRVEEGCTLAVALGVVARHERSGDAKRGHPRPPRQDASPPAPLCYEWMSGTRLPTAPPRSTPLGTPLPHIFWGRFGVIVNVASRCIS